MKCYACGVERIRGLKDEMTLWTVLTFGALTVPIHSGYCETQALNRDGKIIGFPMPRDLESVK